MKIAHITVYPPKGELHCKKSWVAPYTKNLIVGTPYEETDEVYVICDIDSWRKEYYKEGWITIHRVFKRDIYFYQEIYNEVCSIKPDVVHIQQELSLYWNVFTAILLNYLIKKIRSKNIKVIITFHWIVDLKKIDGEFLKENFTSLPPYFVKKAFQFIFYPLIRNSDWIIVHEELFKNRIVSQYQGSEGKITVISHGIEVFNIISKLEARKKLWIKTDRKVLLFMWYITWYKWIDLLIEWFGEYIKNFDKEAILYILWPYHPKLKNDKIYLEEYDRLTTKAKKLLWNNHIWDDQFVDWEKMSIYYPASDLVLFPYTRSLSSSWPMAISIGYEIPFLASDVFKESIENDLFLFEREKRKMAEKIDYFFENKGEYLTLVEQMREERLWDKIGALTYNLYKEIFYEKNL